MTSDVPGPFDPAGLDWQRVSPRLSGARLATLGIGVVVMLLVTVGLAVLIGQPWAWAPPAVVVAVTLWQVWLIPRQVRAYGYAERDDDLLIVRGIMFRSMVVVPYGRMQYVDVEAGPIDRAFGIAKVQLHTAAAMSRAHIAGLTPQEAARLRDRLASRGEARLAGL